MRSDDRRRQTGKTLRFDPKTELMAWHTAKFLKRLSDERCRQLLKLAECMLAEDELMPLMEQGR